MFESPMNYLMVKSDFKKFLEHFYQARALFRYAYKFQVDSMFTIRKKDDMHDPSKKKLEASYAMLKSLNTYLM